MLSTSDASAQFSPGRDCATANIADNDRRFLSYIYVWHFLHPTKYEHLP